MEWTYNDGGRKAAGFRGTADDCVTRAIAIVTGTPYREVYDRINALAKDERHRRGKIGLLAATGRGSTARGGVLKQTTRRAMEEFGLAWTPTMRVGQGCTVHLVAEELPEGRIICNVSKHVVAVIDGVIHDTHNPSDRGATMYPPNYLGNIPPGATRRADGYWIYAPERCVYGYWWLPGGVVV